ncbi:MAG: queuosine precursor transporter [Patescibacteria group bacterium]|nr:queuosine precursor transporter [Patescibacteria group bacterium]MDD4610911.1 queuosine precursor transporter [Patescibacteria group bacterium]
MERKNYIYFDIIMALFVAVLLISNIASTKIVELWKFTFDGGTLLFPLSYIFGDILTEVYGYKKSRKVIWTGFFCAFLMSATLMVVTALPAPSDWPYAEAFRNILGLTSRIVAASLIAYFAGEFSNSYVLAKMKIGTKGKYLWTRTISSTLVGEAIDTFLFISIAFAFTMSGSLLLAVMVSNYIFKCGVEIIFTPLTYKIVRVLKKRENEDYYDYETNFNPFALK